MTHLCSLQGREYVCQISCKNDRFSRNYGGGDHAIICAPRSIQNTNILITLGKRFLKTKDLSAQTLTITSKVGLYVFCLVRMYVYMVSEKKNRTL